MTSTSRCDVLVVGAGPAGAMLGLWMSRLGVKARIVDKRGSRVINGQADGLCARTLEVFESFNFLTKVMHEGLPVYTLNSWATDEDGVIRRTMEAGGNSLHTVDFTRYSTVLLNQGLIEKHLAAATAEQSDIVAERGVMPTKMTIDESLVDSPDAYPITVELQHLTEEEAEPFQVKSHAKNGEVANGLFRSNLTESDTPDLVKGIEQRTDTKEIVQAKYVVGCDGAHSWVREQLGFEMQGESTDFIWGVIDILPITTFPDIRTVTTVESKSGTMLIIPREKKLVRLYTQLKEVKPKDGKRTDRSQITIDTILEQAKKILAPYTLDYQYCDWWTAYQVGQRVSNGFQDKHDRVFLAGDAVHTHSPKGGQGMNTSMADTFNMGWKLGSVINGWSPRAILRTYVSERRTVAEDLISMDQKLSRAMSGGETDMPLPALYDKYTRITTGFGALYQPSIIVSNHSMKSKTPPAASNIEVGTPLPSLPVQNYASSSPYDLQSRLRSDGRWRLLIFPGDITSDEAFANLNSLAEKLTPLVNRSRVDRHRHHLSYAPRKALLELRRAPLIDVITVLRSNGEGKFEKRNRDVTSFHRTLVPLDDMEGYDYDCVFVDIDMSDYWRKYCGHVTPVRGGQLYERYGIDVGTDGTKGAFVVCRPDQYVSLVAGLDELHVLEDFFAGVLLEQPEQKVNGAVNGSAKHVDLPVRETKTVDVVAEKAEVIV